MENSESDSEETNSDYDQSESQITDKAPCGPGADKVVSDKPT